MSSSSSGQRMPTPPPIHCQLRRASGGRALGLRQVREFRSTCAALVRAMDGVMRDHLRFVAGRKPW